MIEPPSLQTDKQKPPPATLVAYSAFRYPLIRFSRSRLRMATGIDLSTRQMGGCANRHLIFISIIFSGSIFTRPKERQVGFGLGTQRNRRLTIEQRLNNTFCRLVLRDAQSVSITVFP